MPNQYLPSKYALPKIGGTFPQMIVKIINFLIPKALAEYI
tara:strand:- start:21 stop:140 length:120 start_codon:yes stop_codon:yes gene_type:complete